MQTPNTILAFALALASTSVIRGAIVGVEITGRVTGIFDNTGTLGDRIRVGDMIQGFYLYESTTPDTNASPGIGHYRHTAAPFGLHLRVNGFRFQTDPQKVDFLVEAVNDYAPFASPRDSYGLISYYNLFDISLPLEVGFANQVTWSLSDETGAAISSEALPSAPPRLTDWASDGLRISSYNVRDDFVIRGEVTSAVLMPEPAAWILMSFGIGALLCAHRLANTDNRQRT